MKRARAGEMRTRGLTVATCRVTCQPVCFIVSGTANDEKATSFGVNEFDIKRAIR